MIADLIAAVRESNEPWIAALVALDCLEEMSFTYPGFRQELLAVDEYIRHVRPNLTMIMGELANENVPREFSFLYACCGPSVRLITRMRHIRTGTCSRCHKQYLYPCYRAMRMSYVARLKNLLNGVYRVGH